MKITIPKISRNFSQNKYSRSHIRNSQYRNNYSRSNSNQPDFLFDASFHSNCRKKIIQIIDLETLHTTNIEIIPTIVIEFIQINETLDIKIINHAIFLTTDQKITIIKTDHAIIHRIEIRVITIDKETTHSHHTGITHIITIYNKIKGVLYLNIKGK